MGKLYDLHGEIADLNMMIDEASDEEVKAILASALEVTMDNAADVMEYLIKMHRNYEADAAMYKAEKDAFATKQSSSNNKAANLKSFIDEQLKLLGFDGSNCKRLQAGAFRTFIQKNGAYSLVIDPEAKIPDQYYLPVEPKLDRERLLEDIKSGQEISGVSAFQSESVRIK